MPKLKTGTYPAYFDRYINLVETDTISATIEKYAAQVNEFFDQLPAEKSTFKYAEGKWSIKELLQHCTDTERIFAYRALCIARGDKSPLPGFDENLYAEQSGADQREWNDILEEFKAVRRSTDLLLKSFTEEQLNNEGSTNGETNTANALSFIIFGHLLHHMNIIKERYFAKPALA